MGIGEKLMLKGGTELEHWLKDPDPWCSHKIPFSVQNSNFEALKWIGPKLALGFTPAVFKFCLEK